MKVLTIKFGHGIEYEIHMLNPGETFPGFGGSSAGLLVGKTASMVVRRKQHDQVDTEYDIHDPRMWRFFAEHIGAPGTTTVAP